MRSYFSDLWRKDHSARDYAPRWAKLRSDMREAFPTYYSSDTGDAFARLVGLAIKELDKLKPPIDGPGYLGDDPSGPYYGDVTQAELAAGMEPVESVIEKSIALFNGMPNWNHPLIMPNVIPPANTAAILAAMMTNVFSPNIIEGEYSWNVEKAEMESAAIISKLIGWDATQAGGLYTFGGSGCYFYGLKYALSRVLGRESRCKGIRIDAKLLVSQQGHYCMMNSTDWTGLGMDNIITIKTNPETNAMDLQDLEDVMKELHGKGIPIASVVCTMGTTDAFAIDPVAQVRELIEKYPNPNNYGKTLLYCDAVIGWSWLTFKDYDFSTNPLGFNEDILPELQRNAERMSQIYHADAIGCDFHKTGWATYNCSIVMFKDLNEFRTLMTRPGSAYLQERTCYNPGLYTLEVSRSGSYAMAGWATLKFLGHEGFQSVLGGILEIQQYLREKIAQQATTVCVNSYDYGFVTLFRVYPPGVDAEDQYEKELRQDSSLEELKQNNLLQQKVADKLWEWFRDGNKHGEHGENYGPYTSYTSGFRPTEYNRDQENKEAVIYALKSYPMNVNIDAEAMDNLLTLVLAARDEVWNSQPQPPITGGSCPLPYSDEIEGFTCDENEPAKVENLLSGIVNIRRKLS
ncbi:hypothetical protein I8748_16585 [Nostoc sp. CENA67]|uniref:Aspartate aminotransferase family protein n=1 Tax=Amazonocrinis nigriterrae CENA67 TaxID=2794033 RepID=A0A8J7HPY7_9NOST|nr:pyridoxal-dependent decarboxylase [Amazonocrinis nigriterrae]MBH8563788.1 hypothetical protein [Amazonocrinis nigriterrae CENA67]